MTTYIFVIVCVIAFLLILSRVPGLAALMIPVIWTMAEVAKGIATMMFYWTVYLIRIIFRSHRELIAHLFTREEDYDMTALMESKERS